MDFFCFSVYVKRLIIYSKFNHDFNTLKIDQITKIKLFINQN